MTDEQTTYNLCYFAGHTSNEIFAFSTGFALDNQTEVLGQASFPKEAIFRLHVEGVGHERYESGIELCPAGRLESRLNAINVDLCKSVKKTLEAMHPSLSTDLMDWYSLSGLERQDVSLLLHQNRGDSLRYRKPFEIYCIDTNEFEEKKAQDWWQLQTQSGGYIDSSQLTHLVDLKIPKMLLRRQSRGLFCSADEDNYRFVAPQITFPTHSKYNHFRFDLGQFDQKKQADQPVEKVEDQISPAKAVPVDKPADKAGDEDHIPF